MKIDVFFFSFVNGKIQERNKKVSLKSQNTSNEECIYTDPVTITTHTQLLKDSRRRQQQRTSEYFFFFVSSISVYKTPQKGTPASQSQNRQDYKFPKSIGTSNTRDPELNHQKGR